MSVKIQCKCGSLQGEIIEPELASRCLCYCRDCQAFAHHLKCGDVVLDGAGGTEVVQTNPANLRFTKGAIHLRCLRLSEKGLLRWYATCCNSPIGNTPASIAMPFVGLVHTCVSVLPVAQEHPLGRIQGVVNTGGATSDPKPKSKGMPWYLFKVVGMMLKARINGSYKRSPFFDPNSGTPTTKPIVLSDSERATAYAKK